MIRILAVDDSALMRRLLTEVFEADGEFELRLARSGAEALALLAEARPDVITLDIHMPEMDGLACLDRIMLERPCPVVMFSSLTAEGARETLEALALGAVDFVPKPDGAVSLKMDEFGPLLIEKVKAAAKARPLHSRRLTERIRLKTPATLARRRAERAAAPVQPLSGVRPVSGRPAPRTGSLPYQPAVLVGASTGGPPALDALLRPLPPNFPWPIVVAQHMPASFTGPLAARLDRQCALTVTEVARPTPLRPGQVYIGRGDADLILSRRAGALTALPAPSDPALHWHPSVDRLVRSAAALCAPEGLVGVLMTGMGDDGAAAMTELRQAGGRTIAEAEETAVVWGMPGELVRAGGADVVAPLEEIAARLLDLVTSP